MQDKKMTLYTSIWGESNYRTFKMMPIAQDSPFIEAIYDGETKMLAVISAYKHQSFTMMDRLDKDGGNILIQDVKKNVSKFGSTEKAIQTAKQFGLYPFVRERVSIEKPAEYYLSSPEDIEAFVKKFADNADTFNYRVYLDAPPIVNEQQAASAPIPEEQMQMLTSDKPEGLSVVKE